MADTNQSQNFNDIKKTIQKVYEQMNNTDKVTYWENSVYKFYKEKHLPTAISDKMIFEKLQEVMEIKVSDEIRQQVYNLMSYSLKSRQQAVYQLYRKSAREKIANIKNKQQTINKVLHTRSNDMA